MKKLLLISFSLVFLNSCNSLEVIKRKKKIAIHPHLIHPLFFQEEISSAFNFPFWFNDSLIQANKIKQISQVVYHSTSNDTSETIPFEKKSTTYSFTKQGRLEHVQVVDFYDGIIIQSLSYAISSTNAFGYSKVYFVNTHQETDAQVPVFYLKEKTSQSIVLSSNTKDRILYVLNHNYFGPLSVDSIARPKPNDWIVLGKPNQPKKRYKVINTVKESNVTIYKYIQGNYPKKIVTEDYPFIRKRFFRYDQGILNNFVDSIFVDDQFVTSVTSSIIYEKQLPQKIVQKKTHEQNNNDFITLISLKYTLFE